MHTDKNSSSFASVLVTSSIDEVGSLDRDISQGERDLLRDCIADAHKTRKQHSPDA